MSVPIDVSICRSVDARSRGLRAGFAPRREAIVSATCVCDGVTRVIWPVKARTRLETNTTRRGGRGRGAYAIPDSYEIQDESYARFGSRGADDKRKAEGSEGVLKEIFPDRELRQKLSLSYCDYELRGKPRYSRGMNVASCA